MNRCEFHEIAVSALLDGALEPAELLPTVDHLLGCPSCRAFYRDARALGTLLPPAGRAGRLPVAQMPDHRAEPEGVRTAAAESPADPASAGRRDASEDLWRRIEAASARRGRRPPAWAARAAAVLLLALGGWWAVARGPALPAAGGAPREIVLGSATGRMSEERFVDLATEVLEADPRYQREMLRVLREVTEQAGRPEAPAEDGAASEREGSAREEGPGGPA